jgi:hypothetical protein
MAQHGQQDVLQRETDGLGRARQQHEQPARGDAGGRARQPRGGADLCPGVRAKVLAGEKKYAGHVDVTLPSR